MDLQSLRTKAIEVVKDKLRNSVGDDLLIIQTISNIEDLDKSTNLLSKRLREWYELYNPEFSRETESHDKFATYIVMKKDKKEKDSMGADLPKKDMEAIMNLAVQVKSLLELKDEQQKYLDLLMEKKCLNIKTIT